MNTRRRKPILVERSLEESVDDQGNNGWRWSTDPRLMHISPNRYSETQILEMMADIQAPLLFLHGDPLPDFIDIKVMKNRMQAAHVEKIVCIKGHHHLHMQRPQQTAEEVRRHIANHLNRDIND